MTVSAESGARPKRSIWFRVDRIMRWLHLYTGLFLVPWMVIYALSAFLLNHGPTIREWLDLKPGKLVVLDEVEFEPSPALPDNLEQQALAVLKHVDLDGAHRVLAGQSNATQLKVVRLCARGRYVVTWNRVQGKVLVQQQKPFTIIGLINFLHFKGGYGLPYPAHLTWAVIVDLVAISIIIWVISGIYIWARRPSKRILGGVTLFGGCALFVVLVVAFCL